MDANLGVGAGMMKPKMQLSPGDYVSDAFRAEINAWMVDFFGYEEDQKPIAVSVRNDANIVKAKTKRQKKALSSKSLGDLLANIDETFKLLEFDIDDVSFYRSLKSDIVGLKKCSPLITDKPFLFSDVPSETVSPSKGLPAYFVIAINQGDSATADTLMPDFAFGMRVKKVPWNVTRMKGTVYLFGLAWRDGKKHIWHGFWLSVFPDGTVKVADELQPQYVKVGKEYYTKNTWQKSAWHGPQENRESAVRHCFCEALDRYQQRGNKWNIGVSNGKKRIVFLIPDNEAKDYFKGRIKVATSSGKTKPIIHFVHAHTQHHSGKDVQIPSHIRGIREFDWSGYHCTITAPDFHVFNALYFGLDAETSLDEELPDGMLGIGQLGEMLNGLEDQGQKRKRK